MRIAPESLKHAAIDNFEEAPIMGKRTRRTFMKDCSTSGAALMTLSGIQPADAGPEPERKGTPYLCVTCGTQFSETVEPPAHCPICEDERQYVNPDGQKWTTLAELRSSHKNVIKQEESDLYSINTEPRYGIGQRAFLIRTDKGNILWDCVALVDDATIARVTQLGGIAEIAISHPITSRSMAPRSATSSSVSIRWRTTGFMGRSSFAARESFRPREKKLSGARLSVISKPSALSAGPEAECGPESI
jgi:hypothetical protein